MKKLICLGASLFALSLTPVISQESATGPVQIIDSAKGNETKNAELTEFSLDFPGGKPGQLIAAIEKAIGKPINVVILDKDADVELPALELNSVNLPSLFKTLKAVSESTEYVPMLNSSGFTSTQPFSTGYEFNTLDHNITDNSVWYFHVSRPPSPPAPEKVCRFFQLTPYLDQGLTVNDITTAIQTAWKMQGLTAVPEISYHKETKLLIAVGEPYKLAVIEEVLKALEPSKPRLAAPAVDPNTGLPLKLNAGK